MRISGDREIKLYGLFGFPLSHTVSPAIQNRALEFHKLKAFYFAFERSEVEFRFLMRHLSSLLLDGFNVTVPYKEKAIPFLDRLHPSARQIGAVNTVKKERKSWVGYNTDFEGFLCGLHQARFNPKGKRVVLLGAGGAARAVCFALAFKQAGQITVFDQFPKKTAELTRHYKERFSKVVWQAPVYSKENLKQALHQADLLINATPIGLHEKDPLLVEPKWFPARKIVVYDLIYKPRLTKLLKIARRLGHRTVNGETMLLMQGARAFEIWTGRRAPVREMRKALCDALSGR